MWLLLGGLVLCLVIIIILVLMLIRLKKRLGDISSSSTETIRPSEYKMLGDFATEKGELQLARRCYRRAVELESYDQKTPYKLGLSYFQAEQYEEAIVFMGDASAGLPQRFRIHYNLRLLLQKLRWDTEAESALKRALALEGDNPDYLYVLAVFYLERGDLEKAGKTAEKLNTVHPDLPAGNRLMEIINRHLN